MKRKWLHGKDLPRCDPRGRLVLGRPWKGLGRSA